MEPLLKLPDIAPASPSVIGDLARRLICGDWTAIQPIRDALNDAGRTEDLFRFNFRLKTSLARVFVYPKRKIPSTDRRGGSQVILGELLEVLWFDVFDADSSIAALAEFCKGTDFLIAEQEERLKRLAEEYQTEGNDETNSGPPIGQEVI